MTVIVKALLWFNKDSDRGAQYFCYCYALNFVDRGKHQSLLKWK